MEPTRDSRATLVDLLDRVLDKGLVLDADLMIHVAGIPLLGVSLRACLAGMETMLKYGIWQDWDEAQRAAATEEHRRKKLPLAPGEEILLKMFASQWYSKGIYHNWRPGHLYITNRKVVLFRKEVGEVLFQCPYKEIKGAATERKPNVAGRETDYLYLLLSSGELVQLHPSDALAAKKAIEETMKALRLELEEIPLLPKADETARRFLSDEEQVVHFSRMSHSVTEPRPGGIATDIWKPGRLYLTTQRLVWWYDFNGKVALEVPLDKILRVEVKRIDPGGMGGNKPVLALTYRNGVANEVATFSHTLDELNEWQKIIADIMAGCSKAFDAEDDTEECPTCGCSNGADRLPGEGCPVCGWVSPKLKGEEVRA